jgi:molybdopterin/thiamine biosynthesis adenylyltransferase
MLWPAGRYTAIRQSLLLDAPNEAAAFLICERGRNGSSIVNRLVVRDVLSVPPEAYSEQRPDRLVVEPAFVARAVKQCRRQGSSLWQVHTHPGSTNPRFSAADDAGEARLIPAIFNRAPGGPHGTLVIGDEGFEGRVYAAPDSKRPLTRIVEVGRDVRSSDSVHPIPFVDEMHDRNVRAFGAGQYVLQQLNVGIVGLGGLGSLVVEQLAHLGIGGFVLLDPDILERSNLNRVVGATPGDVGRWKVDVAAAMVERITGGRSSCEAIRGSVLNGPEGRHLLECDVVFCATDSHGSRAVLNQMAYQFLLPVIDVGVRIDAADERVVAMAGRVQMLAYGLPCLLCHNLLDADEVRWDLMSEEQRRADPYIVGFREPQPAIISINGTLASMAVTMLLSAFVGLPSPGRHLAYRILDGTVRRIGGDALPNCVVCSADGVLARGDSWPMIWRE